LFIRSSVPILIQNNNLVSSKAHILQRRKELYMLFLAHTLINYDKDDLTC